MATYYVKCPTDETVNCREKPSTSADIVARLHNGIIVDASTTLTNGFRELYSPVSGYMQSSFLSTDEPEWMKLYGPGLASTNTHEQCKRLQEALNKAVKDANLVVDGVWGPNTSAAVKKFQEEWGLDADGIAGPETKAWLYNKTH